jgi:hypothetical protein
MGVGVEGAHLLEDVLARVQRLADAAVAHLLDFALGPGLEELALGQHLHRTELK